MVKNHALKTAARARKAETGETLPEAIRNSITSITAKPVIHLGSGVYFDMNLQSPHLHIVGATNSGKTSLVRHILRELENANVHVTVLTDEMSEMLKNPSLVQVQSGEDGLPSKCDEILESMANRSREIALGNQPAMDKLQVLVVDPISSLSDESSIYLQMIYKWGSRSGVHVISTAQTKQDVSTVIQGNSHFISVRKNGFCSMNSEDYFHVGAADTTGNGSLSINIGAEQNWGLDKGNLMFVSIPGAGKTLVVQDIARQALLKGKQVTVMTNRTMASEWGDEFGDAIELVTELSPTRLDALMLASIKKGESGPASGVLIVEEMIGKSISHGHDMLSSEEKMGMSSLVNFLRGGYCPTIVTTHELPWFHSLFPTVALMRNFEGTARISTTLGVVLRDIDPRELNSGEGFLIDTTIKVGDNCKPFKHVI